MHKVIIPTIAALLLAAPAAAETTRAVDDCRAAVGHAAAERFGVSDINVSNMESRNMPGHGLRISGTFFLPGDDTPHRFACSVDESSGRVQTVRIGPPRVGSANRENPAATEVESCQQAVDNRLRYAGYSDIAFGVAYQPRVNQVTGTVRAVRGPGRQTFAFSCRLDPSDGELRAVVMNRRR